MVFTYKGEDVADTLLRFAKEYRVGHIVVGRSTQKSVWRRLRKNRNIVNNLIKNATGLTVIVLDTREEEPPVTRVLVEIPEETVPIAVEPESSALRPTPLLLSQLLSPRRIVIWDGPVQKQGVLQTLTEALVKDSGGGNLEALLSDIREREKQGSTFFNEGVAFPHVRVNGLHTPVIALGLTRQGVSDVSTDKPIEIVFLILSPAESPDIQVQILSLASHAAQNRYLLQSLRSAQSPQEAMRRIFDWEVPNGSNSSKTS
jgi:two-component system sensor histidine kinase KdpD